jgi:rSAM/selenodomain-associated transferase 2
MGQGLKRSRIFFDAMFIKPEEDAANIGNWGISVIIPVLHEAQTINGVIEHLRALSSPSPLEIIVVDGGGDGDTIKAIRNVVRIQSPRGRGRQMNSGAAVAKGDILLFLHADTFLPAEGLKSIAKLMSDSQYVAGAFDLGIRTPRRIFRITEKYVAFRTRLTRIPFGDQAIFIRKDYFDELGGYRDIPIMEDVELMGRVKGRGDRICIVPKQVMTSPRRWEQEGVLYCTLRNWMLQLLYVLGVSPRRLAKFYRT